MKIPKINIKQVFSGISNTANQAKEKIEASKIGSTIKSKVDEVIKTGGWALLLPVAPQMQAALKTKGIKPPSNIGDLALSFYRNIVSKSSFDSAIVNDKHGFAHFTEVTAGEYGITNPTDSLPTGEAPKDTESSKMSPAAIDAIISAVLSYIKSIRTKRESGVELTPAEKKIDEITTSAENAAEEGAIDEANRTIGEMVLKYLPFILGAFILLWVAKRQKWI